MEYSTACSLHGVKLNYVMYFHINIINTCTENNYEIRKSCILTIIITYESKIKYAGMFPPSLFFLKPKNIKSENWWGGVSFLIFFRKQIKKFLNTYIYR